MEELLLTGSIAQIQKALTSRQLSVPDIVDWYLSRTEQIDRAGPKLNAVRSLAADARDTALRLDEELTAGRCRGPLHGIPVLLKDNILARDGMTAAAGSAALADFEPKRDATLVRRLRQAGAIILGKTNLTEFADYVSDVMPSDSAAPAATSRTRTTMNITVVDWGQASAPPLPWPLHWCPSPSAARRRIPFRRRQAFPASSASSRASAW